MSASVATIPVVLKSRILWLPTSNDLGCPIKRIFLLLVLHLLLSWSRRHILCKGNDEMGFMPSSAAA